MTALPGKRVIIVGGGASGVLMACHLLREERDDFVVILIERRSKVGPGVAYSTSAGASSECSRREYERILR